MPDPQQQQQCPETEHEFLIIMKKTDGGMMHTYVMLDHGSCRLAPKVGTIIWPRMHDVVEFRVAVIKNQMYVVGGREKSSGKLLRQLLRYDPVAKRWKELASMRKARAGHTATALNGKIFVTGGQSGGEITSSCESYEPYTDEWSKEPEMPAPRKDHACVERSGVLYVSGGQSKTQSANDNIWMFKRVWEADAKPDEFTYTWETLSDEHQSCMSYKLTKHCSTMCRGRIYFTGGVCHGATTDGVTFLRHRETRGPDATTHKAKRLIGTSSMIESYRFPSKKPPIDSLTASLDLSKSTQLFNKATNKKDVHEDIEVSRYWRWKLPNMEQPRCASACVVVGNKIYMIGGHRLEEEEGSCINTVDYYHTKREEWTSGFSLGSGDFRDVDCAILTVPTTNGDFKPMCFPDCKWVMW